MELEITTLSEISRLRKTNIACFLSYVDMNMKGGLSGGNQWE
jgi:hypothetical protein